LQLAREGQLTGDKVRELARKIIPDEFRADPKPTIIARSPAPAALKPITISVNEAKRLTGLGHTKIYELMNDGRLKSIVLDGRRLVILASLEALVGAA
jgi:hypothetical protein